MKKVLAKVNIQSMVTALCIVLVCIGTQQMQTVKWDTGKIEFFRDLLGVLMAVILFTHYQWQDFLKYKRIYIGWSVAGGIALAVLTPMAISKRAEYLLADTIIISLGIFLMGYCLIHTAISFFLEKQRPKYYKPLFVIWVVMLLWMIFSKSDYLWPECYFVLFGCYYLTPQTSVQRQNVMKGIVNGLILGFLAIQGHAFLCRPYDVVRYKGNFCNPNHNCAFLCFCLAAILAKILFLTREMGENKWEKLYRSSFFVLAGACYSFIAMTASRSGYLATVVITIFFLLGYCQVRRKRLFIKTGALLVLIFVVMLPVTYTAVRYLPTIHPHVLFYFQEGYSEERVHSTDPRDSGKYVSFEELMYEIFGRIAVVFGYEPQLSENDEIVGIYENSKENLLCFMGELPSWSISLNAVEVSQETVEVDPDKIPVLDREDGTNNFEVRYTIYKWFFTHLSLRGMPYDEQGFQLTADHWVQHAHNIYLDYGINFGYPAMILFAVFVWWGIGRLVSKGVMRADVVKVSALLFVLAPAVFGLLEFIWGAGYVNTVIFYLAFREILVNPQEDAELIGEVSGEAMQ